MFEALLAPIAFVLIVLGVAVFASIALFRRYAPRDRNSVHDRPTGRAGGDAARERGRRERWRRAG